MVTPGVATAKFILEAVEILKEGGSIFGTWKRLYKTLPRRFRMRHEERARPKCVGERENIEQSRKKVLVIFSEDK